jgi:hypothetical protein
MCISCVSLLKEEKVLYIYEKERRKKEKKKCDHITFLTQRIKRHESRKERNSKHVI